MTPDERMERAAERFADSVHETIRVQVERAWSIERDRLYAELTDLRAWQRDHDRFAGGSHDRASVMDEIAELRDEVATVGRVTPEHVDAELVGLNRRMEKMSESIAELMSDAGRHSVKVDL